MESEGGVGAWWIARCACPVDPNQLGLFDADDYYEQPPPFGGPRPPVETAASGHLGFWYRFTPEVFLGRRGVGPLLVASDTDVLIEFVDALCELDEGPFLEPPSFSGSWSGGERAPAVVDLIHLWYHRDVRFLISETYMIDSKKPLDEHRVRIRERVVKELYFDCFGLRGGVETRLPDILDDDLREAIALDETACPIHPRLPPIATRFAGPMADIPWPTGRRDRQLVADALGRGCHVFLTYDRGILKRAAAFARCGLAIMTPAELFARLDATDELYSWYSPLIDLDTLTRIWKISESAGPTATGHASDAAVGTNV